MFAGSLAGAQSPARVFSAVTGAQVRARRDTSGWLALTPGHEHVVFTATGSVQADGVGVTPGQLLYLGTGRDGVQLAAAEGSVAFLLGGEPLGEPLLMWWNFVGRTPEDIIEAARDWAQGTRFGTVTGYRGAPLVAPPLDVVRLARPGAR